VSYQATKWVLEQSQSRRGTRLVLLSLAEHASWDGLEARPSVKTISKQTCMTRRQVQRCLRELEEDLGEIKKTREGGNKWGKGLSASYDMLAVRAWAEANGLKPKDENAAEGRSSVRPLAADDQLSPQQEGRNPQREGRNSGQERATASTPEPYLTIQEKGKPRAEHRRAPDTALELEQKRKIDQRDRREKLEYSASRATSAGRAPAPPLGTAVRSSVVERFLQRGKLSA